MYKMTRNELKKTLKSLSVSAYGHTQIRIEEREAHSERGSTTILLLLLLFRIVKCDRVFNEMCSTRHRNKISTKIKRLLKLNVLIFFHFLFALSFKCIFIHMQTVVCGCTWCTTPPLTVTQSIRCAYETNCIAQKSSRNCGYLVVRRRHHFLFVHAHGLAISRLRRRKRRQTFVHTLLIDA